MVWTAKVSSKGQLVLPKAVRDKLGVTAGSKVLLTEHSGGFELRAVGADILGWYGAQQVDGPQDWDAIEAQIGRERARETIREQEDD